MEISSKLIDGIKIVFLSGNIVMDETGGMRSYMERSVENSAVKGIIINCKNIEYIDSSGLGLIVSIYKNLKRKDKYFALSALSRKTKEIFLLTRLNEILVIADTDESALESFHSWSDPSQTTKH